MTDNGAAQSMALKAGQDADKEYIRGVFLFKYIYQPYRVVLVEADYGVACPAITVVKYGCSPQPPGRFSFNIPVHEKPAVFYGVCKLKKRIVPEGFELLHRISLRHDGCVEGAVSFFMESYFSINKGTVIPQILVYNVNVFCVDFSC